MFSATVQGRFPFAGQMREPGEVLDADTLSKASRQVIDAMVAQKLLVLNTGEGDGGDSVSAQALAHLQARYDALADRVGRLEKSLAEEIAALRESLPAAVDAAVARAMEAFTAPTILSVDHVSGKATAALPPADEGSGDVRGGDVKPSRRTKEA